MKTKNLFIILGIIFVVLIGIVLYFVVSPLAINSIFNEDAGSSISITIVRETPISYIYKMSWSGYYIPGFSNDWYPEYAQTSVNVAKTLSSPGYDYHVFSHPTNVQIGKSVIASSVTLSGAKAMTNNPYQFHETQYSVPIIFENLTGTCKLTSNFAECKFSAIAIPGGSYSGMVMRPSTGGSFTFEIPKQGIECLDDSYCAESEECVIGFCQLVTPKPPVPPQPILSPISQFFINIWNWFKELFS